MQHERARARTHTHTQARTHERTFLLTVHSSAFPPLKQFFLHFSLRECVFFCVFSSHFCLFSFFLPSPPFFSPLFVVWLFLQLGDDSAKPQQAISHQAARSYLHLAAIWHCYLPLCIYLFFRFLFFVCLAFFFLLLFF